MSRRGKGRRQAERDRGPSSCPTAGAASGRIPRGRGRIPRGRGDAIACLSGRRMRGAVGVLLPSRKRPDWPLAAGSHAAFHTHSDGDDGADLITSERLAAVERCGGAYRLISARSPSSCACKPVCFSSTPFSIITVNP